MALSKSVSAYANRDGGRMTVGNWVIAVVGLIGVAANLMIADLQRRQMRQIEAARRDPSIGLAPPLHPVRLFLRRHGWPLWDLGFGIYLLSKAFLQYGSGPITRDFVVLVAVGFTLIAFGAMFWLFTYLFDRVLYILEKMTKSRQ